MPIQVRGACQGQNPDATASHVPCSNLLRPSDASMILQLGCQTPVPPRLYTTYSSQKLYAFPDPCLRTSHPRRLCPSSADHDGSDFLGLQLIKVQDTIPIHSAIMSQKVALGTLRYGEQYTEDKIATLQANRQAALKALEPLGTLGDGVWGGDAIYLFARLPEGVETSRIY